jgi:Animal haem peroxidase
MEFQQIMFIGYDPSVDPQIDQFFQTSAMRFGHTLVTPGVYMRDYAENGCKLIENQKIVRTCNFFWRSQVCMLHTTRKRLVCNNAFT